MRGIAACGRLAAAAAAFALVYFAAPDLTPAWRLVEQLLLPLRLPDPAGPPDPRDDILRTVPPAWPLRCDEPLMVDRGDGGAGAGRP
ncbi:MAG TPA: hypothetical protein VGQ83_10900, partial [Polyangia bacterium]